MQEFIELPEEYWPKAEELTGDLRRVAEQVEKVWPEHGVKVALILGQLFPGVPIYPANMGKLLRKIRNDAIIKEYDAGGVTAKDLAIKNGLCQRQVEVILGRPVNTSHPKRVQGRLF